VTSEVEQLSLEKAASLLLEECRMVLPGIQALFGFQFVAVFSAAFGEKVTHAEQVLHLAALMCVALSAALVLAPAALHRRTQPRSISASFLKTSSRLLEWSMIPLALGTSADVYIVTRVITHAISAAIATSLAAVAMFGMLWIVLPWRAARRQSIR